MFRCARPFTLSLPPLLLACALAAQSAPAVRVNATAAAYVPAGDFAVRGGGLGADRLRMDEGFALGLSVESLTPIRWLGVRTGVDYAGNSAVVADLRRRSAPAWLGGSRCRSRDHRLSAALRLGRGVGGQHAGVGAGGGRLRSLAGHSGVDDRWNAG